MNKDQLPRNWKPRGLLNPPIIKSKLLRVSKVCKKLVTQDARAALLHRTGSSFLHFSLVAGRLGTRPASGTWNRCSKETDVRDGRRVWLML